MLLKQVKPFPSFCDGKQRLVEKINVLTIKDNWVDHMVLKYTLTTIDDDFCGDGLIDLQGDKYPTDVCSVESIYQVATKAIGLELK